jgi:hypothetical protein
LLRNRKYMPSSRSGILMPVAAGNGVSHRVMISMR